MSKVFRAVSVISLLVVCFAGLAQPKLNAPLSSFGFGNIIGNQGSSMNRGNGIGIATSNEFFVNGVNPALLPRTKFGHFDYGMNWDVTRVGTQDAQSTTANPNLSFINIALPVSKSYCFSVGFQPYSTSTYDFTDTKNINDQQVKQNYRGEGGITKLYWGNGFNILNDTTKNVELYAGIESAFLFGRRTDSRSSQLLINGEEETLISSFDDNSNYRGYLFKPGFAFRKALQTIDLDSNETIQEVIDMSLESKYCIMIPGKSSIKVAKSIQSKDEKGRLIRIYTPQKTENFGLYVKPEAAGKSQKELEDDFVQLYVKYYNRKKGDSTAYKSVTASAIKEYLQVPRNIFYSIGFYSELSSSMSIEQVNYIKQTLDFDQTVVNQDTISTNAISTNLPVSFGLGLSIEKPRMTKMKDSRDKNTKIWSLGLDAVYTNWDRVDLYPDLSNTFSLSIGGEIQYDRKLESQASEESRRADGAKNSGKNYFRRIIYRSGLHYSTLPFSINGNQLSEVGINFGLSLPLGRVDLSRTKYINLIFATGQRGTVNTHGLKENYFNTTISFSVNEKWFTQRKLGF